MQQPLRNLEHPMAQSKILDLTDVIPELNHAEEVELSKIFANPIVHKYFRAIGMQAVFEQASIDHKDLNIVMNDPAFLLEMAFQKGVMHTANLVINYTPKEQQHGTSPTG